MNSCINYDIKRREEAVPETPLCNKAIITQHINLVLISTSENITALTKTSHQLFIFLMSAVRHQNKTAPINITGHQ